jgi:hypothetical protein
MIVRGLIAALLGALVVTPHTAIAASADGAEIQLKRRA